MSNADRSARARTALAAYAFAMDGTREPEPTDLQDLLCDLMHMAAEGDETIPPFDEALTTARINFEAEQIEEGGEET